jgi:hypothetical protein
MAGQENAAIGVFAFFFPGNHAKLGYRPTLTGVFHKRERSIDPRWIRRLKLKTCCGGANGATRRRWPS